MLEKETEADTRKKTEWNPHEDDNARTDPIRRPTDLPTIVFPLARQMSRLEITQKPKKSNPSPQRISVDSGQKSTWLSSHTRTPSRVQPTASAIHAATELGLPPITAPGAPETSNRLSGGASSHGSGVLAALGFGHETEAAPGVGGLATPETPPPLKGHNRRASLVNNTVEEDPAKEDLMIGEIKVRVLRILLKLTFPLFDIVKYFRERQCGHR